MDHFTVLHSTENSVLVITGIQAACNAVLLQLQRQMASVQGFTEALQHEVVILSRIRWKNKSWALRSMEPNPQSKRDLVFEQTFSLFFLQTVHTMLFPNGRVGWTLRVVVQYGSSFLGGEGGGGDSSWWGYKGPGGCLERRTGGQDWERKRPWMVMEVVWSQCAEVVNHVSCQSRLEYESETASLVVAVGGKGDS